MIECYVSIVIAFLKCHSKSHISMLLVEVDVRHAKPSICQVPTLTGHTNYIHTHSLESNIKVGGIYILEVM